MVRDAIVDSKPRLRPVRHAAPEVHQSRNPCRWRSHAASQRAQPLFEFSEQTGREIERNHKALAALSGELDAAELAIDVGASHLLKLEESTSQ